MISAKIQLFCTEIVFFMIHHWIRPEFLSGFSDAGTIQDYVVSMLCNLDKCVMTGQNAASWGYFNTTANKWNTQMWVKLDIIVFNSIFFTRAAKWWIVINRFKINVYVYILYLCVQPEYNRSYIKNILALPSFIKAVNGGWDFEAQISMSIHHKMLHTALGG